MVIGHTPEEEEEEVQEEQEDDDNPIDWDGQFSIGDKGIQTVGSDYMKEKYFEEEKEPPSYSKRIPLGKNKDTGEIEWISIEDDDRWAVIGRCVHPETEIRTNKGYKRIDEMFDKHSGQKTKEDDIGIWYEAENLQIVTMNENGKFVWKQPSRFYRQKIDSELVKLELSNGSEIKVTQNHPLMNKNGWKKSGELDEGERIAIPKEHPAIEERNISEQLAELISFQIAEGHEKPTYLELKKKDPETLKRWRNLYDKLVLPDKLPEIEKEKDRDIFTLVIRKENGLEDYKYLLEKEIDYNWGNLSADKEIPQGILEANKEAKKVFLRNYLDTDGSISQDRKEIEFPSASEDTVDGLREILKEFGITSSKDRKEIDGVDYWRIRFSSRQVKKYEEKIGWRNKSTEIEDNLNPNYNGIPVCHIIRELKDRNIPVGQVRSYDSGKMPSKEKIEGLIEKLEEVKYYHKTGETNVGWNAKPEMKKAVYEELDLEWLNSKIEYLEEIIQRNVWWVEIEDIEFIEHKGYVYDITVPKTHNFLANDVLSKNTGSGKTYTLKEILSRAFVGGANILHLSDVKNDFDNIDHGDGIQKRKMNLLENEVRRPIPVDMYAPKFMKDDYQPKPPQKDNFHFFSYEPNDLSESDFTTLLGATSQSKRDIAMELYDEIDEDTNLQDLIDYIEEEKGAMEEANTNSKRSVKTTLKNLKRQGVVSKRGSKKPLDNINDSFVALAFENWDRYKRESIEKLEIQISITTRKTLDMIREGDIEDQTIMVVDEAHAFVPDDRDSVSADDIVNVVDLGRAYGVPMIFATQKYTDLSQGVRTQCNKFLLSQTITPDERKKILKSANIYETGDSHRNKWQRLFKRMDKHEWLYIDKKKSSYKIVKPISPLCAD